MPAIVTSFLSLWFSLSPSVEKIIPTLWLIRGCSLVSYVGYIGLLALGCEITGLPPFYAGLFWTLFGVVILAFLWGVGASVLLKEDTRDAQARRGEVEVQPV